MKYEIDIVGDIVPTGFVPTELRLNRWGSLTLLCASVPPEASNDAYIDRGVPGDPLAATFAHQLKMNQKVDCRCGWRGYVHELQLHSIGGDCPKCGLLFDEVDGKYTQEFNPIKPVKSDDWQWPDWLNAEYIARDADGDWWAYQAKPKIDTDSWELPGRTPTRLRGDIFNFAPPAVTDWKQSLRKNPNI